MYVLSVWLIVPPPPPCQTAPLSPLYQPINECMSYPFGLSSPPPPCQTAPLSPLYQPINECMSYPFGLSSPPPHVKLPPYRRFTNLSMNVCPIRLAYRPPPPPCQTAPLSPLYQPINECMSYPFGLSSPPPMSNCPLIAALPTYQ